MTLTASCCNGRVLVLYEKGLKVTQALLWLTGILIVLATVGIFIKEKDVNQMGVVNLARVDERLIHGQVMVTLSQKWR